MRGRPVLGQPDGTLRLGRSLLAVSLFLLAATPCGWAEDGLGPPGHDVAAVLEAVDTDDDAVLAAAVSALTRDPWIVAHELCVRGHLRAAGRMARVPSQPQTAGLKTYIRLLQRRPPSVVAWRQRCRALEMNETAAWYDVLAFFEKERVEFTTPDVPTVQLLMVRGAARANLDQTTESLASLDAAAEMAEGIGWLRGAVHALELKALVAYRARSWRGMMAAQESLLRIQTVRGDRHEMAQALANLGTAHGSLGDYRRAAEHYERALARYGDVLSASHRAQIRVNAGLAYLHIGDLAEALALATHAEEDAREDEDESVVAYAWQLHGQVLTEIGDFAGAREHFERARDHHARAKSEDEWAACVANLAWVDLEEGDLAASRENFERALAAFEAQDELEFALLARLNLAIINAREGQNDQALRELHAVRERYATVQSPSGLYGVLDEIALVYRKMGDVQRALAYRMRALDLATEMGSVSAEATSLTELAWLLVDRKQHDAALVRAAEAARLVGLLFDRLPAHQAARARQRTAGVYDVGLAAAVGAGDLDAACTYLEGGRAGALLVALEGRSLIHRAFVPGPLREREAVARTAQALARREYLDARREGKLPALRAARDELERTRRSLEQAVERIQLEAGRAADLLYPQPAGRAALQAALTGDEALVLYGESRGETVAVVLTAEEAHLRRLGPAEAIQAACDRVRIRAASDVPAPVDFDALRALVVEPLAMPKHVRRVLVSPMGCLSYQPSALLFPEREVAWVPSGTTYLKMREHAADAGASVLALGDPELRALPESAPQGLALRGGSFGPLPESREEARRVGDVVLLGADASETRLREVLPEKERWRAVHFACHGLVDEARPSFSTLLLSPTDADDGLLTALEVFQMRIPADLVVLAACESGLGPLHRAEGIIGLTRSFISAGASSVLVSLWKVPDRASRELMVKFHEYWNHPDPAKRLGAAAALRAAQEHVRSTPGWEHPLFWAAWQQWGRAE